MTLVALCSGKGSPGVSTLACVGGAVWPPERQIVVAECDPSGNDLATRFGLSQRLGMASLVLANRRSEGSVASIDAHIQTLPGGLEVLAGPISLDAAGSLDRELAATGPAIFPQDVDMIVDCGRILSDAPGQRELLRSADHVVTVIRPDASGLAHGLWTLEVVGNLVRKGSVSFAVVGASKFRDKEMEQALGAHLVGTIPFDEKSAAMVSGLPGKPRSFARSGLVTSTRRVVHRILQLPGRASEDVGESDSGNEVTIRRLSNAPPWTGVGFDPASTELGGV